MFQRIREENPQLTDHIGGLLYGFLELLIAKDMHHLQELEEKLSELEEEVLEGVLDNFNYQMTALRKELTSWSRYYTQLEDMVCEFEENENEFFTDIENTPVPHGREADRAAEKRGADSPGVWAADSRAISGGDRYTAEPDHENSHHRHHYFSAPDLSSWLVWENFSNMPELSWKYGYPAVIVISLVIVMICLWTMKKKKFW